MSYIDKRPSDSFSIASLASSEHPRARKSMIRETVLLLAQNGYDRKQVLIRPRCYVSGHVKGDGNRKRKDRKKKDPVPFLSKIAVFTFYDPAKDCHPNHVIRKDPA